jgi:hypothetical protein
MWRTLQLKKLVTYRVGAGAAAVVTTAALPCLALLLMDRVGVGA